VVAGVATRRDEYVGPLARNKPGFGFIVPSDPAGTRILYISQDDHGGAITGDVGSRQDHKPRIS